MEKRLKIGITMTTEIAEKLNVLCNVTGLPKSYVISLAIAEFLKIKQEEIRNVQQ